MMALDLITINLGQSKDMEDDGNESNFEKRYTVVIEKDITALDGYEFYSLDDDNISASSSNKRCVVVYYFKMAKKKRNPVMIIESIDGEEFPDRRKIISHFEMHHALRFSVTMDGLYK